MTDATLLGGARVLIVEDSYLVGLELAQRVRAHGGEPDGPHATVHEAERTSNTVKPRIAILDVNLRGDTTFALAARLMSTGVKIMFITGYSSIPNLPANLTAAPVVTKPIDDGLLVRALRELHQAR